MSGKYGVIVEGPEGNYQVIIVSSQDAATALRDRLDAKMIETFGTMRVVTEKQVIS